MDPSQRFNYTTNYGQLMKFMSPFLKLFCLNNQNCGFKTNKKQKNKNAQNKTKN